MTNKSPTASLIIIGNEILSGRTEDKNINFIAKELSKLGIIFHEVRIIKDIESDIVNTVNELRAKYNYVFTTGGIGPTHDDITSESVAKAFKVEMEINQKYYKLLDEYYKGDLNEGRVKMVTLPIGAVPIDNELTIAPGYRIENVFIMAGIPKIMQKMFEEAKKQLDKGNTIYKQEIILNTSESVIAKELRELQTKYADVDIGSYPFYKDKAHGIGVALNSINEGSINNCTNEIKTVFSKYL